MQTLIIGYIALAAALPVLCISFMFFATRRGSEDSDGTGKYDLSRAAGNGVVRFSTTPDARDSGAY
jgi:hypothetical protein